MNISDETLMAYADGELQPAAHAEIEAAIARDPELAGAVERHRALAARIRAGYEGIAEEPVPERLVALFARTPVAPAGNLATLRAGRGRATVRWQMPQWAALAASVALAFFVGVLLWRDPATPYEEVDGALVARGRLEKALTTELASMPSESSVSIGISFRDRNGVFCRTFRLKQDSPVAGLACRGGTDWQLHVLADAPTEEGEIRAAGTMPLAVLKAVDAAINGEPLDAAAEAEARDAGWRNAGNVAE